MNMKSFAAIIAAALMLMPCIAETQAPKLSVLGDSYSTFKGSIPDGYDIWYTPGKNGVDSPSMMWWSIVAKGLGGEVEKIDAWSGSTVSNSGYRNRIGRFGASSCGLADYTHQSFITRADRLGCADVILVFGGTNDDWAGVPMGENMWEGRGKEDLDYFRPALAELIVRLRANYPKAKIAFILNSDLKKETGDAVHDVCSHYGMKCIDLKGIEKAIGHPTAKGMESIAAQVLEALKD